jgi:hypothetical protein
MCSSSSYYTEDSAEKGLETVARRLRSQKAVLGCERADRGRDTFHRG